MKTIIRTLLVSILLNIVIFSFSSAQDRYLSCMDAYKAKNYEEAIPCLREAVRKDKKSAQGFFYLGKALFEVDSLDASVAAFFQARDLDTANIEVYEFIGDAYTKQNLHSAAIDYYQKAADMDSLNAGYHEKLADAFMKIRKYTEAATEYRRVIARDTNNLPMYQKLGNLLYRANQYNGSLPFLKYYVDHEPNALKEKMQVITAMYSTKRYAELIPYAESAMKEASLDDSTKTSMIRVLALSYAKTKDNEKAETTYQLLETKDTLGAEEYLELAKAQKALEKTDSAIASFEKARAKDPTLTAIFYDLGSLYMSKKMYKEAAGAFEAKIATDTTAGYQFASHLNAGLSLMQIKEYKAALAHIKASLEIRPDYLTGWSALASCYAQMDSTSQQRTANQKVIELISAGGDSSMTANKNKLEEAYRVEGIISFQEKRYDRALDYLKKAYQVDAKNCQTNLLIAQCYAVQKDNDEAKKYLCKCFSICPKNEDVLKLAKFIGITAADCK